MSTGTAARICVIYYSATGNVAKLAHAIGEAAAGTGAEVRVRRVRETAPQEAIATNPRWQEWLDACTDEYACLADLEWSDAIAIGSPTRFGGPASQLKAFLDTTGGLWFSGVLADKVGTAFTSSSTQHGGLESTILAMNNIFYHWGSIVMPLGYAHEHIARVSGNPYGSSFVSRKGAAPDDDAITAARVQGERLAIITSELITGRQTRRDGDT
jgi:NAD(P)H dehydrogenase (quinone)